MKLVHKPQRFPEVVQCDITAGHFSLDGTPFLGGPIRILHTVGKWKRKNGLHEGYQIVTARWFAN